MVGSIVGITGTEVAVDGMDVDVGVWVVVGTTVAVKEGVGGGTRVGGTIVTVGVEVFTTGVELGVGGSTGVLVGGTGDGVGTGSPINTKSNPSITPDD